MTHKISKELIKACFQSEHYAALMHEENTHDPGLHFVGDLPPRFREEGLVRSLIESALPEGYGGNTRDEILGFINWWEKQEEESSEQSGKEDKGLAKQCLNIIERMNPVFFHNQSQEPCITFCENAITRSYFLNDHQTQTKIEGMIYKGMGRSVNAQTLREVMGVLKARALFDGPQIDTFLRVAGDDKSVSIYTNNERAETVVTNKDGHHIPKEPLFIHVSSPLMKELPLPQPSDGSALTRFQELLGLEDHNFHRIIAAVICFLHPTGPYPILIVQGEQGSGKSELCRMVKSLVDPSAANKLLSPKSEVDLMLIAKNQHVSLYDNLSGMKGDISDAICALLTGGGFATRQFYTNGSLYVNSQCSPVIINGISDIVHRPDLLDRSISVYLSSMPENKRKTEREIRSEFEALHPYLLHELLEIVSCAIKHFDEVPDPKSVRMIDAARWLVAAEQSGRFPENALLNAFVDSQREVLEDTLFNNSFVTALLGSIEEKPYEGYVGELYDDLCGSQGRNKEKGWPQASSGVVRYLNRLIPGLRKIGVEVEIGKKDRKGRSIKIGYADYSTSKKEKKY